MRNLMGFCFGLAGYSQSFIGTIESNCIIWNVCLLLVETNLIKKNIQKPRKKKKTFSTSKVLSLFGWFSKYTWIFPLQLNWNELRMYFDYNFFHRMGEARIEIKYRKRHRTNNKSNWARMRRRKSNVIYRPMLPPSHIDFITNIFVFSLFHVETLQLFFFVRKLKSRRVSPLHYYMQKLWTVDALNGGSRWRKCVIYFCRPFCSCQRKIWRKKNFVVERHQKKQNAQGQPKLPDFTLDDVCACECVFSLCCFSIVEWMRSQQTTWPNATRICECGWCYRNGHHHLVGRPQNVLETKWKICCVWCFSFSFIFPLAWTKHLLFPSSVMSRGGGYCVRIIRFHAWRL